MPCGLSSQAASAAYATPLRPTPRPIRVPSGAWGKSRASDQVLPPSVEIAMLPPSVLHRSLMEAQDVAGDRARDWQGDRQDLGILVPAGTAVGRKEEADIRRRKDSLRVSTGRPV